MNCCICGKDLTGQPAMVDRVTGEAFCERDAHYFGMHPSNRPNRSTVQESTESRYFYGKTEEEAKVAAQQAGIAPDKILDIKVTRQVQSRTAEGASADKDKAINATKERVPSEAFDVGTAKIIRAGESGVVEVQAQTEMVARQQWQSTVSKEAVLDKIECIVAPREGFFGIGKKPGMWKAYWSIPFKIQISYKLPAEVTLRYKESTSPTKKPTPTTEKPTTRANYSGYSKAVIYCRAGFDLSTLRLPGFTGKADVIRSGSAVQENEIIAAMLLQGCDKDCILLSPPDYGVGFIK